MAIFLSSMHFRRKINWCGCPLVQHNQQDNLVLEFLTLVAFANQNYKHANDFFLYLISATALRYQEELMRLRLQKRQQEARKISLVNAVRILQHRGSQSRSRLSIMMTNNLKKEKETTEEIEKVISTTKWMVWLFDQDCKQLRGDIDEQHKIRMEAFEFKMQPIVINEEPSRKVSSIIIVQLLFIHFKRL